MNPVNLAFSRSAALLLNALAAAVLVGWAFRIDALKAIKPGYVAMNPLTAVLFGLAGRSLLFAGHAGAARRRISATLAVIVSAAGAAKLLEIISGGAWGIDRWLFTADLQDNRMEHSFAVAKLCEQLAGDAGKADGCAYLVGLCHDLSDILPAPASSGSSAVRHPGRFLR